MSFFNEAETWRYLAQRHAEQAVHLRKVARQEDEHAEKCVTRAQRLEELARENAAKLKSTRKA